MAGKGATGGSKTIAALIVGMVLGMAIAGAVAWYMTQQGAASFKEPPVARDIPKVEPPPVASPPAPPPAGAAPAQQFEFYRALPDKAEGPTKRSVPPAVRPSVQTTKPSDAASYMVQAGSFQSVADAEKLKARLALVGMEASIQSVDLSGKGIWHRVRLGPYRGLNAANETIDSLKANGVANATASQIQ